MSNRWVVSQSGFFNCHRLPPVDGLTQQSDAIRPLSYRWTISNRVLRHRRTVSVGTEVGPRWLRISLAFVALSAFGPYVAGGMRTEQVTVYTAAGVGILLCGWTRVRPTALGALVLGLLLIEWVVAVIGAIVVPPNLSPFPFGNKLAGLDNLTLPIAVLGFVWLIQAAHSDHNRQLQTVCRVVVIAMCANALLAYWSQAHDLTPLLRHFWDSAGLTGSDSVAGRSAQLGRFTGLFNEPAEAGLMYSIALLSAIYLYRSRSIRLALIAALLIMGGVLTVSKTFLLVGLPIAAFQLLQSPGRRRRVLAFVAVGVCASVVNGSGVMRNWIGGRFLSNLLHPQAGLIEVYTAGRFGQQSTLGGVTAAVLHNEPLFGFGAAGLAVPYDNAWVEALAVSGLMGALAFSGLFAAFAVGCRRIQIRANRRFAGGLLMALLGASLGLPALTANRCATVVWLLLGLSMDPLIQIVAVQCDGKGPMGSSPEATCPVPSSV